MNESLLARSDAWRPTLMTALATGAGAGLALALLEGAVIIERKIGGVVLALRIAGASAALLVPIALVISALLGIALARLLRPQHLDQMLGELWRAPSGPLSGHMFAGLIAAILFLPLHFMVLHVAERHVQSTMFRTLCAVLSALLVWAFAWMATGALRRSNVAARLRPRWILLTGAALIVGGLVAAIAAPLPPRETVDALQFRAALAAALGGGAGLVFSVRRGPGGPLAVALAVVVVGAVLLSSQRVRLVLATESIVPSNMQALLLTARASAPPEHRPPAFAPAAPESLVAMRPVVLITLEGVSARALGIYGYRRATSPNLDAWARSGVVFEAATAQSAETRLSVPSMLVGRYPAQLAMTDPGLLSEQQRAADDTLAELLAAVGYHCVVVRGKQGSIGRIQGAYQGFVEKRGLDGARAATNSALGHLVRAHRRRVPTFLWVQYADASPPASRVDGAPPWSRRDQNIWSIDRAMVRLLKAIERELGERDPLVIVTGMSSDRPEAALDVPLIVRMDGLAPRRVKGTVALLDVFPTILDLLGVPTRTLLEGRSLVPELLGKRDQADRVVLAELGVRDPRVDTMAARAGNLLVVEDPLSGRARAWTLTPRGEERTRVPERMRRRIAAHAARLSIDRDTSSAAEDPSSP